MKAAPGVLINGFSGCVAGPETKSDTEILYTQDTRQPMTIED